VSVFVVDATGLRLHDAIYLTLAVRLDAAVVTGDDRLVDRIAGHALLAKQIRRLQDGVG
jgi:predicted nucleic acid-binding protein